MARQQKSKWCRRCKAHTLHIKSEPRKMGCAPHIILSLFTLGLWIPFAILTVGLESIGASFAKYHCQTCGK